MNASETIPVAGVTAPCPHGPHQAALGVPPSLSPGCPVTFQLRCSKGNFSGDLGCSMRSDSMPSLPCHDEMSGNGVPAIRMGKEDACSAGYSGAFSFVYLQPGWKCGGENAR